VSTRDRVIAAASGLFADRGYSGTTIQEIEAASGLSPGSGSLYRHFRSKRGLLEAVVTAQLLATAGAGDQLQDGSLADDLDTRLHAVFSLTISRLARSRELIRMLLRESQTFPELVDRLRDEAMTRFHQTLTGWLLGQPELAGTDSERAGRVAAVAIAALSHYWFLRDSFRVDPYALDESQFISTVVELTLAALHPTQ
jgi:AcrR family transcriptional regulator